MWHNKLYNVEMRFSRRRLFLLSIFVVAGVAAFLLFVPFGLTTDDADRIETGTRLSEVEAILGTSTFSGQNKEKGGAIGLNEVWDVSDGYIQIVMDGKGPLADQQVVKVLTQSVPKWRKLIEKIKKAIN